MHVPTELVGSAAAVALFAVPGYGLTELFGVLRRLPWPRRAAYGYLLGVVAVAGGLYALSHVFAVPLHAPAVWICAAIPTFAGLSAAASRWLRRTSRNAAMALGGPAVPLHPPAAGDGPAARRAEPSHPIPGTWQGPMGRAIARAARVPGAWMRSLGGPLLAVASVAAAFICLGVLAEAASNPIRDWDGRMTWSAQARYIRAAGTVDAEVLQNPRWYISHPQYPLLLPVAQVAALEGLAAGPDSHLQRALYAGFLPVLLLLVYDGARRAAGRAAAALTVLAVSAVPFFAYGEGGAWSTYSDLPLACFDGAALLLLLRPRPELGGGIAAGFLLAGAVLSKNEGALLAALALALAWRGARRLVPARRGGGERQATPADATRGVLPHVLRRRYAAAALPVILALVLLASWRHGIPNREDEDYPLLVHEGAFWPEAFSRVTALAPIMLRQMVNFPHWEGFWWMALAVLAAGHQALRHPRNRRFLAAATGPPAIGWAACLVNPNPYFLASASWERMLLQAAVPLAIVLAGALGMVLRRLSISRPRYDSASARWWLP